MIVREADPLQHSAFFEALGGLTEGEADWHELNAGLLVLRLVDAWLTEGSQAAQVSAWGIRNLRNAVERIPATSPSRTILAGIIEIVESAVVVDVRPIAPRLMAYGRSLDYTARWALAADVFQTLLAHLHPALDPDIAFDARMRLGYCLRQEWQLEAAEAAYVEAGLIGKSAGSRKKELHAQVGLANVVIVRGNLPKADTMLSEVIAASETEGCDEVRAIALHDRAFVANGRARYEEAASLAYAALQLTTGLRERDRILNDLAISLTQLGGLESARDAFLVLAATAQEQYVRWLAMINLLEVGSLQSNEALFERYRRELVTETLPPYLRAQFHYYSAVGHRAFGRLAAAQRELDAAGALAEQHAYNQLQFEVEALATHVRQGLAVERRAARELPASLQGVAEAVSEMRALAGV